MNQNTKESSRENPTVKPIKISYTKGLGRMIFLMGSERSYSKMENTSRVSLRKVKLRVKVSIFLTMVIIITEPSRITKLKGGVPTLAVWSSMKVSGKTRNRPLETIFWQKTKLRSKWLIKIKESSNGLTETSMSGTLRIRNLMGLGACSSAMGINTMGNGEMVFVKGRGSIFGPMEGATMVTNYLLRSICERSQIGVRRVHLFR